MNKIKEIQIKVIFEDGDFVHDTIDGDQEFVADLYANIRIKNSRNFIIPAMTYLMNIGSKAITGINPKMYINGISHHFGDSRNINDMRHVEIIKFKR